MIQPWRTNATSLWPKAVIHQNANLGLPIVLIHKEICMTSEIPQFCKILTTNSKFKTNKPCRLNGNTSTSDSSQVMLSIKCVSTP
jgi:hypothetical protein